VKRKQNKTTTFILEKKKRVLNSLGQLSSFVKAFKMKLISGDRFKI